MYKIGNIRLENQFVLAPLEGVNCAAFRLLCKEQGASLVYTSMLHATGIVKATDKFLDKLIDTTKKEKPVSMQLVGSLPEHMKLAAEIIEEYADIIDINLGCSVENITKIKAGAYLLKKPEIIEKIVSKVTGSTNKPVTAKIRLGYDGKHINYLRVGKLLEDLGISAIALHARTAGQMYSGKADWTAINALKEISTVPIIGNGDVFLPEDGKKMLETTGCDLVMMGRAAIGNPSIFRQCNDYLKKGRYDKIVNKEQKDIFLKFLKYYEKYSKMNKFAEIKQHSVWFTRNMTEARRLREALTKARSAEEIKEIYLKKE